MPVYCTICSEKKNGSFGTVPAIERYKSKRITAIHQRSLEDGAAFLILSGKYGLIRPEEPILYYDYTPNAQQIVKLTNTVAEQIRMFNIDKLVFFYKDKKSWQPYIKCIESACELSEVELEKRLLE